MVTRTELLSIIRQCELLDLPRSTFYHVPKPVSESDLALMKLVDRCHTRSYRFTAVRSGPHKLDSVINASSCYAALLAAV